MVASTTVLLGFAGRLVGGGERTDHTTTKVGGVPDWPMVLEEAAASSAAACLDDVAADASLVSSRVDTCHPSRPPAEMTSCSTCGAAMSLVVQAHAPLQRGELPGGASVSDRTLYLMTCFDPACPGSGTNEGRWRAVRAQRAPPAEDAERGSTAAGGREGARLASVGAAARAVAVAADEGAAVSEMPLAGDDWGAGGGADDWGASGGNVAGADAFGGSEADGWVNERGVDAEMDDLANALDALATANTSVASGRSGRGKGSKSGRGKGAGQEDDDSVGRVKSRWDGPSLPEFYLVADWEPDAAAGAMTAAEKAKADRLLAQYVAAEGITSTGDLTAAVAPSGAQSAVNAEWQGERYEKGTVEGLDKRYLKFSKRMRRAPDQCVRYAFGGEALCWPLDGPSPETLAPPCSRCKAPRICEMQLMPPLLHFASEALEWTGDGGGTVNTSQLDAWDWQAVAVFTCSKSCGGGGNDVEWAEEVVKIAEGDGGIGELLSAGANLPMGDLPGVVVTGE